VTESSRESRHQSSSSRNKKKNLLSVLLSSKLPSYNIEATSSFSLKNIICFILIHMVGASPRPPTLDEFSWSIRSLASDAPWSTQTRALACADTPGGSCGGFGFDINKRFFLICWCIKRAFFALGGERIGPNHRTIRQKYKFMIHNRIQFESPLTVCGKD